MRKISKTCQDSRSPRRDLFERPSEYERGVIIIRARCSLWRVLIMKLLILEFAPAYCYYLSLGSKCSQKHSICDLSDEVLSIDMHVFGHFLSSVSLKIIFKKKQKNKLNENYPKYVSFYFRSVFPFIRYLVSHFHTATDCLMLLFKRISLFTRFHMFFFFFVNLRLCWPNLSLTWPKTLKSRRQYFLTLNKLRMWWISA